MGVNRVTHHATGTRQGGAEFAVHNAQQQHGESADQPGNNPGRPGDRGHVAGREQPARTEDGAQPDKGEVHQ